MTQLLPMRPEEFTWFFDLAIADYAADNIQSGRWPAAEALSMSRADIARLLPQGVVTPDQFLYTIHDEVSGQALGFVWFAAVERGSARLAHIYQIHVEPEHRRQGHARAALRGVEEIAAAEGLSTLALHVFDFNQGAKALYHALGYHVVSVNMEKPLKP